MRDLLLRFKFNGIVLRPDRLRDAGGLARPRPILPGVTAVEKPRVEDLR